MFVVETKGVSCSLKCLLHNFFSVSSDPLSIYSGLVKKFLILNNLGGFYGLLNTTSFGLLP